MHIVVVDPHRPGHELRYHPGETNLRMADVCVVNKVDSAPQEGIDAVLDSIRTHNPDAQVVLAGSPFHVEGDARRDRRQARARDRGRADADPRRDDLRRGRARARRRTAPPSSIDPRDCAVGSIAQTFEDYPNVGALLPAMGYGRKQMDDLTRDDRGARTPTSS